MINSVASCIKCGDWCVGCVIVMHQDAHEFLNHLLLRISEILEKEQREERENDSTIASASDSDSIQPTWVQRIFEGKLVHETKCLRCETVTSREEVFMDLQLAIEHNCSLTSCLKRYRSACTQEVILFVDGSCAVPRLCWTRRINISVRCVNVIKKLSGRIKSNSFHKYSSVT